MWTAQSCATLTLYMKSGEQKPKTPEELAFALRSRVEAGARRYRGALMRYLLRPPLSLKAKYAAFLVDFAKQSDHMQELLGRAASRLTNKHQVELLLRHQKEEHQRLQLVLADLRKLGYPQESWPDRAMATGDAALRGYGTSLSYDHPVAMLGVLLMFIGLASEISPSIIRLLTVSGMQQESMRWLLLRQGTDPKEVTDLIELLSNDITDPEDQHTLLEAVEVTSELLSLGASSRPSLPPPTSGP